MKSSIKITCLRPSLPGVNEGALAGGFKVEEIPVTAQHLDMDVDVVDGSDRVIGTGQRRHVLQQNAGFRVTHVFVFNRAGDLLLQQIAPGLRHPGQWGSSVAGYLRAGEDYRQAAERKLQ